MTIYAHKANCGTCQLYAVGDYCPHCWRGLYAYTGRGRSVTCDACRATGKVLPVTEFAALADAAVNHGTPDATACLALADYLEERGDELGVRLRRRAKVYEQKVRRLQVADAGKVEMHPKNPNYRFWADGFGYVSEWYFREVVRNERETFTSYLFRLLSVRSGEPTPRETVGGAYVLVEPGS